MFEKSRIARRFGAALALAFVFGAGTPALAKRDHLAKLELRYARARDAVHKARALQPLGHAQFKRIEQLAGNDDFNGALAELKQYRDEVRETVKALDASGINAEKHTAGFKQLEFSIRESLRRLDDILVNLSGGQQKEFRDIRSELARMDAHLLHELFPSQPSAGAAARAPRI